MIQLECEIYVYNEEQEQLIDSGIEIDDNISKADLMKYTFYNINLIKPYDDNNCSIFSNGEVFVTNQSYEVIKKRIQEQLTFRFN